MKRLRSSLRGQGKWALFSGLGLALLVSPFAVAGDGDTMRVGSGNSADDSETRIIAQNVSTFATRQSNNKEGDGGSATYGCRSSFANEPCLDVFALRTARAFDFRSRGNEGGRIRVEGNANPDLNRPFSTTATGVATGLNADEVDGRSASDFLGRTEKAADSDKLDGKDSTELDTDGFSARSTTNILGFIANTDQEVVATGNLPAGKYLLTAKVVANNNEAVARQVDCSLRLGPTEVDNLFGDAGLDIQGASTDDRVVVALTGAGTLATAAPATVVCRTNGATGNWLARSITAIQVATLNGT